MLYAGYRTAGTIKLIISGNEAIGIVSGLKCAPMANFDHTGSVQVLCSLAISFSDNNGRQHIFEGDLLARQTEHPKGSKVNVIYYIDNTLSASINTFKSLWLGNIILFSIGATFFGLAYLGYIEYSEKNR